MVCFVHSPAVGRNSSHPTPSPAISRPGTITEYAQDSVNLNQLHDIGVPVSHSL